MDRSWTGLGFLDSHGTSLDMLKFGFLISSRTRIPGPGPRFPGPGPYSLEKAYPHKGINRTMFSESAVFFIKIEIGANMCVDLLLHVFMLRAVISKSNDVDSPEIQ